MNIEGKNEVQLADYLAELLAKIGVRPVALVTQDREGKTSIHIWGNDPVEEVKAIKTLAETVIPMYDSIREVELALKISQ